ncbi:class I tRNA ligase family protein, partial [Pseudomonas aeruginosa]|uniref:class I tRNA ligase family protein n=1 Tax=Pseudomonas aeruginosa TaxID=287 RepID=UPI0020D2368A
QRLALGGGDHLALALVARQAGLDQGLGQHQVAIAGIDQRVVDKLAAAFGLAALDKPAQIVIWTTTPWTIPANQALNVHPEIDY